MVSRVVFRFIAPTPPIPCPVPHTFCQTYFLSASGPCLCMFGGVWVVVVVILGGGDNDESWRCHRLLAIHFSTTPPSTRLVFGVHRIEVRGVGCWGIQM